MAKPIEWNKDKDSLYKILLVGDAGAGKTTISNQYFLHLYYDVPCTICVDFRIKVLKVHGKPVKLQVWDSGGQERYASLTKAFYRRANGVFIVFDITNRKSFEDVNSCWIEEVTSNVTDCVIFLIGNKADLSAERVVSKDEAQLKYFEISGKMGSGLDEMFIELTSDMMIVGPGQPKLVPIKSSVNPNSICC